MDKERKCLWQNDYLGLYNDGELGISDGVGYVDTLTAEETKELYEALKLYYKSKEK